MAIAKEPAKPVAVSEIVLTKGQRARIAKDLGLSKDDLSAVPEKLEIQRFNAKDVGRSPASFAAKRLEFGRIDGGILIPV